VVAAVLFCRGGQRWAAVNKGLRGTAVLVWSAVVEGHCLAAVSHKLRGSGRGGSVSCAVVWGSGQRVLGV
jgi:hypothetical protein